MWSDNDIDNAFQRLNPAEPEPTPFPLDAWLRLESQLDKAVLERAVRRQVLRLFAAEVAIVILVALGWLLWPSRATTGIETVTTACTTTDATNERATIGLSKASRLSATRKGSIPDAPITVTARKPDAVETASTAETEAKQESQASRASTVVSAPKNQRLAAGNILNADRKHSLTNQPKANTAFIVSNLGTDAGSASRNKSIVHTQKNDSYSAQKLVRLRTVASTTLGTTPAKTVKTSGSEMALPGPALAGATEGWLTPLASSGAVENQSAGSSAETIASRPVALTVIPVGLPNQLATLEVAKDLPQPEPVVAVPQPRFCIGLVGAPDISTVKFVDVERPLLNLGLTLEYRLTERLRISTGLLRANKEYYARREDYDWSSYPRAATRDFSWVDGSCTVLDVPLNLRYDAVVRSNSRLFGAAGLSSFFMQRERYTYDYVDNNTPYVWDRSLVNENHHLFSILNLSLGYERRLSHHWGVQAEPYLKVPLAGVGAGKVKLTSAGVFLGLKYGF